MKKYKIGNRIIHANSVVDAVKIMKQTMKDDASKYATIMALIEDEKAAVEAYNVAIRNLEGQIPDESLQAIKAIRDDENRHIENLMAVVNGTVTEKNLEDSLRYTRKAQIYVYPRSSNDKQDILRLCSNLNTKCKILSETNEQMKLEIDGDVDSVVDDLKSLGLMRRGDGPRYIDV